MKLRIACRKSQLAQIQAHLVGKDLLRWYDSYELVTCSTLGDRKQDSILADIGGKGLFVKEVEHALLNNDADIAVHSLKDMPVIQPAELPIIAYGYSDSVYDVLVGVDSMTKLPLGACVGTCSPRRHLQLKHQRPDLEIVPIRGNIQTRIKLLEQESLAAIILAEAGLNRANMRLPYYKFSTEEMLPAAGQGVLAIQKKPDFKLLGQEFINDSEVEFTAKLERLVVKHLGASCHSTLAVFIRHQAKHLVCEVVAGDIDKHSYCKINFSVNLDNNIKDEIITILDNSKIQDFLNN